MSINPNGEGEALRLGEDSGTNGQGLFAGGAHWNLKELLERLDDDREFLCELLEIFREDSRNNLEKANAAMREKDFAELMRAAHTMKGMLRNLAMNHAGEIAFELESAARQQQQEQSQAALTELSKAVSELLPQVEAHLAEVKA